MRRFVLCFAIIGWIVAWMAVFSSGKASQTQKVHTTAERMDSDAGTTDFVVIAHRGASGYLPEHTLAATAMAYAMGADFIEQDVVLTKDDQPIVLHDIHLDTVTNVATKYPNRKRDDSRYYAIDFTLEEIKTLDVCERFDHETRKPVFAKRFPAASGAFKIPTLEEAIETVQGLNQSTGRNVGIYPEIKKPKWHRDQGKDISREVLELLESNGYLTKEANVFVQCFDPIELRRVREELGSKLKLIQLIGNNDWNEAEVDYNKMVTRKGLATIAEYADGIGPWMPYIVPESNVKESGQAATDLVELAHIQGLLVHPFTFRADSLPSYAKDFSELISIFKNADVDGLFTDHVDLTIRAR